MKVPFFDLERVHTSLTIDDALQMWDAASGVFRSGQFIQGPQVKEFEDAFTNYCGTKYCVGVDSGTSALELSLRAIDIKPGQEVITVPNTFYATAYAIAATGGVPRFVDVSPKSLLITRKGIEDVISRNTKAILPVHLFGNVFDTRDLKYKIAVLEDACQAHGAYVGKEAPAIFRKKVGNLGDAAAFSFYPAKNLGAFGDGGAVVTNNEEIAKRIRMLREYGSPKKYYHDVLGGNHRLDTLQAAILKHKLKCLDRWNALRSKAAAQYDRELPRHVKRINQNSGGVYHLYVIMVPDRNKLQIKLADAGIGTGIHYPVPLHLTKAFSYLGYKEGDFPVAEKAAKEVLSLPMFPGIRSEEVSYICDTIRKHYK